jgi:hypothetical protein
LPDTATAAASANRYLTAADNAELELLWFEFVGALESHSQRCPHCRCGWLTYETKATGLACSEFGAVLQEILDYRRHLILHNKARVLRAIEQESECVRVA